MCQERMIDLGQDHPNYVSSSILSKKIRAYYQHAADLVPFFEKNTNHAEVSTDQSFEKTMNEIYAMVEPLVIHVRPGANAGDLRKQIVDKLTGEHGFINLDVTKCIHGEHERGTSIGQAF